jgi:hypothetical protein
MRQTRTGIGFQAFLINDWLCCGYLGILYSLAIRLVEALRRDYERSKENILV